MHFFSPGATTPHWGLYFAALQWALASSLTRFLDHTQRRATAGRTPLNEWSVRRRDLYLTTHNTRNTNIQALGGIRTHDLSRRAVVELRLRPRGHWDRLILNVPDIIIGLVLKDAVAHISADLFQEVFQSLMFVAISFRPLTPAFRLLSKLSELLGFDFSKYQLSAQFFNLQQYICYTALLNMFRTARCSSSGGPIVSPQPLVSSPWKSVNDHILIKWGLLYY